MIWRLAHPGRGLLATVAVWILLAMLAGQVGFGVGLPELLLMAILAVAAGIAAGSHTRSDDVSSDTA